MKRVIYLMLLLALIGCKKDVKDVTNEFEVIAPDEPNTWGKILSITTENDNGSVSPRYQWKTEQIIYRDSVVVNNFGWMDRFDWDTGRREFNPEYDNSATEINRGSWVIPLPKDVSDKFFALAESQNPYKFFTPYDPSKDISEIEVAKNPPMPGSTARSRRSYQYILRYENIDEDVKWGYGYDDSERLADAFRYLTLNFFLPDSVGVRYEK